MSLWPTGLLQFCLLTASASSSLHTHAAGLDFPAMPRVTHISRIGPIHGLRDSWHTRVRHTPGKPRPYTCPVFHLQRHECCHQAVMPLTTLSKLPSADIQTQEQHLQGHSPQTFLATCCQHADIQVRTDNLHAVNTPRGTIPERLYSVVDLDAVLGERHTFASVGNACREQRKPARAYDCFHVQSVCCLHL